MNREKIANKNWMFEGCDNLENINGLEKLNTKIAKNFSGMFKGCRSLTRIDFGDNFNIAEAT